MKDKKKSVSDTLPQGQLAPNDPMKCYPCETVCHMTCNSSLKLAFTESVAKQSKMFNYYPSNSMLGNITNDMSFVLILQNN